MKKLLVITGPSAVGKTFLAKKLIDIYPKEFEVAKLNTTRKPRSDEKVVDRQFISNADFKSMIKNKDFVFYGKFNGEYYGYTKDELTPNDKTLVVNAWPSFIPKFTELPNVMIIGLNVRSSSVSFLFKRMLDRGDSLQRAREREPIIRRDIKDLNQQKDVISKKGKVFIVENDSTIMQNVIPWIEAQILE